MFCNPGKGNSVLTRVIPGLLALAVLLSDCSSMSDDTAGSDVDEPAPDATEPTPDATEPDADTTELMGKDLIVHLDHGSNASSFTARVVVSTNADIHGAITAAIAALSGPSHGGAAEGVMKMALEIGEESNVEAYLAGKHRWQALLKGSAKGIRAACDALRDGHARYVDEIVTLTEIPAPPFKEERRAEAFRRMLAGYRLEDVALDGIGNPACSS